MSTHRGEQARENYRPVMVGKDGVEGSIEELYPASPHTLGFLRIVFVATRERVE